MRFRVVGWTCPLFLVLLGVAGTAGSAEEAKPPAGPEVRGDPARPGDTSATTAGKPAEGRKGLRLPSGGQVQDIRAKEMGLRVKDGVSTVELRGDLRVVSPRMRLRADYGEGQQAEGGEIRLGYVRGNVRIYLDDQTFLRGDRLEYDPKSERLILTAASGNPQPRAWKAGRVMMADQIIYHVGEKEENRVEFVGNARVVEEPLPAEYYEEYPEKREEGGGGPGKGAAATPPPVPAP